MRFSSQGLKTTALLVATTGFFACRTTNDSSVKASEVPFDGGHGMKPGVGYETIFEDVRGECVDWDSVETPSTAQEAVYDLKIIEHTSELGAELNVSSAAQVKAAVPDSPAQVSAKTSFALGHSYSLNRYSIFILASVKVRNETTQLKGSRIKNDIKTQLANIESDPDVVDRLRLTCGDAFMSGYTTGGEFFGVMELATDSEEQKTELKRTVEAALSAEGIGELNTQQSFELKLKNIVKNKNLKVWTYQKGGQGAAQVGLVDTPELMMERVRAFPDFVKAGANAANYTATFSDYFTLNLQLPLAYRNQLLSAQDNLEELAGLQAELIDRRGDIDYILKHPNSFEGLNAAKISEMNAAKTANNALIKAIFKNARDCYRNFRECKVKDEVHAKPLALPKRKATIASLANEYFLIKTKLETVDVNSLYDGPFNPPECYLEVKVVANGKAKRIRRTATGYDKPRCNNLDHTLEVPLSLVREAAKSLGVEGDDVQIEIRVMEDDPGADEEDVVGTVTKSFKDIVDKSAISDTLNDKFITMRVDFEIH